MVKGMAKRVIVLQSPDKRVFEQAIFILREEGDPQGLTAADAVRQAQQVADRYLKERARKMRRVRIPAPVFFAAGAVMASAGWIVFTMW